MTTETLSPTAKIQQEISNLCANIGDQSFVIRQAKSAITGFYVQIDQLRDQLRTLQSQSVKTQEDVKNGSEATK